MSDIPVSPLSNAEIERLAEGWRKALDPGDEWAPDIAKLIATAGHEFADVQGLRIEFLRDTQMGDAEARAESNPPRIRVRESLRADVEGNSARMRSTLAHEFGHTILHPGVPKFRIASGNSKIVNLPAYRSAEAQAWAFARAFLMPSWKVRQTGSAKELSLRCRVSPEIAEIRYEHIHGRSGRPLPPELQQLVNDLKPAQHTAMVSPAMAAERERVRAWERARHIDGENPAHVRRSDDPGTGFRIERRKFGMATSDYGWFVEDGRALAYIWRDR